MNKNNIIHVRFFPYPERCEIRLHIIYHIVVHHDRMNEGYRMDSFKNPFEY